MYYHLPVKTFHFIIYENTNHVLMLIFLLSSFADKISSRKSLLTVVPKHKYSSEGANYQQFRVEIFLHIYILNIFLILYLAAMMYAAKQKKYGNLCATFLCAIVSF